jgi:hypothetical protein
MPTNQKTNKLRALFMAGSLSLALGAVVTNAFAQAAPGGMVGPSTNPGTAVGNNSGGTAPGPVYSGPAAAAGANSPPVNSGITDPKTGANNDTLPMNSKNTGPSVPPGPPGQPANGTGMPSN